MKIKEILIITRKKNNIKRKCTMHQEMIKTLLDHGFMNSAHVNVCDDPSKK